MSKLQTGWQGRGSQAFFSEMNGKVLPALRRLVQALAEANRVTKEIGQLVQTSDQQASGPFKNDGVAGGGAGAIAGGGSGSDGQGVTMGGAGGTVGAGGASSGGDGSGGTSGDGSGSGSGAESGSSDGSNGSISGSNGEGGFGSEGRNVVAALVLETPVA